jgi:hypothetical protein
VAPDDGASAKKDSVLASGYFSDGQNVSVFFDYITPGAHTVTLEAYGALHTYSGILYSGASRSSPSRPATTTPKPSPSIGWDRRRAREN